MAQETRSALVGGATVPHHPKYYLKDGIIFRVEDCLFKIPRYLLESSSPVFASMFQMPAGENESEGGSDDKPIYLSQISRVDFERLMEFLYPLTVEDFFQHTDVHANDADHWISILRLAKMWQMDEIWPRAIENIQTLLPSELFPVRKILLGREFGHLSWVKTGFAGLILRHEPLTEEEAYLLGLPDVVKSAAARENARASYFLTQYRARYYGEPPRLEFRIREDQEDNYVDNWDVKQAIAEILQSDSGKSSPGAALCDEVY